MRILAGYLIFMSSKSKKENIKKAGLKEYWKLLKNGQKKVKNISNDSKFLIRNQRTRRKWHIFLVLKEKKCQPRMPYIENITFRNEGKIQTLWNNGKLRGLFSRSCTLNECLKEIFQRENDKKRKFRTPRKKEYGNSKTWINKINFLSHL